MKITLTASTNIVMVALFLSATPVASADLDSLVTEYRGLQREFARLRPEQRIDIVRKKLRPLLSKIGQLDTDASFRFLTQEFETALPESAAVCAPAILASGREEALQFLVRDYLGRPVVVRTGILNALRDATRGFELIAADILQIAHSEGEPEVKRHVPPVIARLDTLSGAKVLLSRIVALKERVTPLAQIELKYNAAVTAALAGTKNDRVKEWLPQRAFRYVGSNGFRLEVLAIVTGKLRIEEARPQLEKLLYHANPYTAAAAVDALSDLKLGPSVKRLIKAIEKGRARSDLRFWSKALDAIAETKDEKGMETLFRLASAKQADTRAVAIGSLALVDSPEALEAVLASLRDSSPDVRSTTLTALSRKRKKEMVGPLVEYLEREKVERLRIDALKMLVGLTGVNLGLVVADWKKWWETAEATFELPEAAGTDVSVTALRRATKKDLEGLPRYFGLEVSASDSTYFLVDISGSMSESGPLADGGRAPKIAVLKKELTRVLKQLPSTSRINIVSFNAGFHPWKAQLHRLARNGRKEAIDYVQGLAAQNLTNVFDTIEFALKDQRVETIFLLSDGQPTAGRIMGFGAILREVKLLNRLRGVTINCIAFGAPSALLHDLAEQNRGEY